MDNAMKKNTPYFTKIDEPCSSRRIHNAWEHKVENSMKGGTRKWKQV